jgi:hypothetical protein
MSRSDIKSLYFKSIQPKLKKANIFTASEEKYLLEVQAIY